jgi:hypothetical protein
MSSDTQNDAKVLALRNKVEALSKELESTKPKNDYKVHPSKHDFHFNILTINTLDTLVEKFSVILLKENSVKEASKILGIEVKTSEVTLEDWKHDFLLRKEHIEWQEKNRKFKELKSKLDTLLSQTAKTTIELEKIEKDLGV